MKKRIFSLLLALLMLVQITPVFASGSNDSPIQINTVEDLFLLNEHLDRDAVLNTNLTLVINEEFVNKYGASSIGESAPYTGTFYGNDHIIVLDIETDKKSYGLFHYLKGAKINNLNIVVNNFVTSSTSSNISFSGLAHQIRDSVITAGVIYNGNSNGKNMFEAGVKHRNVNIGSIATNCSGNNQINVITSVIGLTDIPDNASVVSGAAAIINDGVTNIQYLMSNSQSSNVLENHASIFTYPRANSYILGGLIGEIKLGAEGHTRGDGAVLMKKVENIDVDLSNAENLETIIGGNIGLINNNAIGTVNEGNGNFVTTNIESFGYADEFSVGGYIGVNRGTSVVKSTSSSLSFENENLSYGENYNGNGIISIGGILGKNEGAESSFSNHSAAVNVGGNNIIVPNAIVYLGSAIGYNEGYVDCNNNGFSLQIKDIKYNQNSSFGYMIGKVVDSRKVNMSYNIINAVDEKSLKGDYDWIEYPFGGIDENSIVSGFKNNYWGYMDYVEIGKPSQIYFMIPMNYFGDNPPEMDDEDFPFLAIYGYFDVYDEDNQYLTFNNKRDHGIGTLTLTKDCVVGTRVKIDVINAYRESNWHGHYYLYEDILGKLKEDIKDEDKEGDNEDLEDDDEKDQEEDQEDENLDEDEEDSDNEKDEEKKKDKDSKDDEYFGPEEYLRDFNQAVITDENGKGEPLPTFNDVENSTVKFNYHELNYEFVKNNIEFDDIKGEKYRRDITQAANRLIVRGVGDNKFEPARPITRAEFAAMVVRALGLLPIGDPEFEDVAEDKWYYDYVNAAASWEIIYGVGDNKYEPEDNITREEAMLILTRAAENIIMKNDFECILKDNSSFIANDTDDFSDWAYEGYRDNLKYGIVSLRDGYKSVPTEPITRAETANAILNLLRNFALIDYTR